MLEVELGQALLARGWTVGTVETDTGGLVVARLVGVPGSSRYVLGGIVAYANSVKTRVLGLETAALEADGVVSEATAAALARAACRVLGVDLGVATTGIAGPRDPNRRSSKPVGLAYVAVASPDGVRCERHQWPSDDRARNMAASADAALRLALTVVAAAG